LAAGRFNAAVSMPYRVRLFDALQPCLTLLEFG
jgi:hypothetical protein